MVRRGKLRYLSLSLARKYGIQIHSKVIAFCFIQNAKSGLEQLKTTIRKLKKLTLVIVWKAVFEEIKVSVC